MSASSPSAASTGVGFSSIHATGNSLPQAYSAPCLAGSFGLCSLWLINICDPHGALCQAALCGSSPVQGSASAVSKGAEYAQFTLVLR